MGGARSFLQGGHLFHFNLTGNRRKIGVDDPRLEDRVADNLCKFDLTESESLLVGRNFGTVTDLVTGPNGNLFVVSIDTGSVFEIFRKKGNQKNLATDCTDEHGFLLRLIRVIRVNLWLIHPKDLYLCVSMQRRGGSTRNVPVRSC